MSLVGEVPDKNPKPLRGQPGFQSWADEVEAAVRDRRGRAEVEKDQALSRAGGGVSVGERFRRVFGRLTGSSRDT